MIVQNENWNVYDSSKLKDFLVCPRYYFFRHILGWVSERESKNIHLIFGESWHRAKEVLFIKGIKMSSFDEAVTAFLDYWIPFFGDDEITEQLYFPKSIIGAKDALRSYIKKYEKKDYLEIKKLNGTPMTEVFGTVPIKLEKPSRLVSFRLDAVCNHTLYNQTCFVDHKTASKDSAAWRDYWQLSLQMSIYTHVLYMLEKNQSSVYGGIIDGTIFRKSGIDHVRVPIKKTVSDMNTWLWEVNDLIDRIESETSRVVETKEDDLVMKAFPRNPESCSKYGRLCPFHDLSVSWSNPLRYAESPPSGFKVNFWNPDRDKQNAKFIIDEKGEIKNESKEKSND